MNRFGTIEKPTATLRLEIPELGTSLDSTGSEKDSGLAAFLGDPTDISKTASVLSCFNTYFPSIIGDFDSIWHKSPPDRACREKNVHEPFFGKPSAPKKDYGKGDPAGFSTATRYPASEGLGLCYDALLFKKIESIASIRSINLLYNIIYLFFWNTSDAILFYRENKGQYKISFVQKYTYEREKCQVSADAEAPDFEENTSLESFYQREASRVSRILGLIDSGFMPEEQNSFSGPYELFNELNGKILLFNRMSRFFVSSEVKRIECMFRSGDVSTVISNAKRLCVGSNTNVLMQNIIKELDESQLVRLISELEYDIGPISATKYGAYVVQTILKLVHTKEAQEAVVGYFEKYSSLLLTHPLGNYSVQDIGRFRPGFLVKSFLRDFERIVKTNIGIRVFRKSLSVFVDSASDLLTAIRSCKDSLQDEVFRVVEKNDILSRKISILR